MRSQRLSAPLTALIAIAAAGALFLLPMRAIAQQETVLYSFLDNNRDGSSPFAAPIFDAAGNLYGTTAYGGAHNYGSVFELSPVAGGGWKEKVLHSFNLDGVDGYQPYASLVLDAGGNLYGTTSLGGSHSGGTVFELSPQAGGTWSEKILHHFALGLSDGNNPQSNLLFDAAGNLYGTTVAGGAHSSGIAFELTPVVGHGWSEKLLHAFDGRGGGNAPYGTLEFDSAGNLYGTTQNGGAGAAGIVYELMPAATGPWTERILHTFTGGVSDGSYPQFGVVFGSTGSLYGTTLTGGTFGDGTVFELSPIGGGNWSESFIHYFNAQPPDGFFPNAVVADASGNLYVSTVQGGSYGQGAVLEFSLGGGSWNETVLSSFDYNDGAAPSGSLVFDALGNLYGTTEVGGAYNEGTVFKVAP